MSVKDAVGTILTRNAFYRDGYRALLRICLILGAVIAVLIGALVSMILTQRTEHVFFATTSDGRIINIVPLDKAYINQGDLVAWASDTVKRTMTFGYNDYRMRLQDVASNFTSTGWESFMKALKEAHILEAVDARKLVVDISVDAAPEILGEGNNKGVYTWVMQLPVTIKLIGENAPSDMQWMLRLTVVRVSTLQHPQGVGIEQWVAAPRSSK